MDREFLQERIEATKALIVSYEEGLAAFSEGIQSYTLDTGQGRQVVTRADIGNMNRVVNSLYNRLTVLRARLEGGTTSIARPQF